MLLILLVSIWFLFPSNITSTLMIFCFVNGIFHLSVIIFSPLLSTFPAFLSTFSCFSCVFTCSFNYSFLNMIVSPEHFISIYVLYLAQPLPGICISEFPCVIFNLCWAFTARTCLNVPQIFYRPLKKHTMVLTSFIWVYHCFKLHSPWTVAFVVFSLTLTNTQEFPSLSLSDCILGLAQVHTSILYYHITLQCRRCTKSGKSN